MPTEPPKQCAKPDAKSAPLREIYREVLQAPHLADREIDAMRQNVIRLTQALCEHVWGKRFY